MEANPLVVVETTIPRDEAAWSFVVGLVQKRLAACVTRVDAHSAYWWEDEVEEEPEWLVTFKTSPAAVDALTAAVKEGHPYDLPMVVVRAEDRTTKAYGSWVAGETGQGASSKGPPS